MKKPILLIVVILSFFLAACTATAPGGTPLGTIKAPDGIPNPPAGAATENYVAGLIKNGISILIIVSFIVMFLWTIFAGFRFITSGGDEKSVSQAWSQIYWGIIGMIVVMGSYAIVRLLEIFFQVDIVTGGLKLP